MKSIALKIDIICIDSKTGRKVLMDNHHPKGDHVHLDENEISYEFTTPEALVIDFKKLVLEHFGVKL